MLGIKNNGCPAIPFSSLRVGPFGDGSLGRGFLPNFELHCPKASDEWKSFLKAICHMARSQAQILGENEEVLRSESNFVHHRLPNSYFCTHET
jgi:hypothetical protein